MDGLFHEKTLLNRMIWAVFTYFWKHPSIDMADLFISVSSFYILIIPAVSAVGVGFFSFLSWSYPKLTQPMDSEIKV